MAYRKLRADKLFDGRRMLEDQVLVLNEEGRVVDLLPSDEAGDSVEQYRGILSPGLVNCHCHLELSHLEGFIPEHTGLVDFVSQVVTKRRAAEDQVMAAIEKAESSMLANGIVAVGDICNTADTVHQKSKGRLHYHNFIELSGWSPSIAATRLQSGHELMEKFRLSGSVRNSIVPHAPYSVSKNLWQLMSAGFSGQVVSMHNQETTFEDEFFRNGSGDINRMFELLNIRNDHFQPSGSSSLQSVFSNLAGAERIILVHNSFTSKEDISYVNAHSAAGQVFYCLCINANQYIENTVPPLHLLREYHCQLVLGTDSLASNHQLNLMKEIKTLRRFFPSVSLEECLQWATLNGARALQMDEELGSFEKGKTPGVILIDAENYSVKRLV